MANKRDASKQKRARQNRAQREALKARTDAASRPSRSAPERKATGGRERAKSGTTRSAGTAEPARTGFFSSLTKPRGERPGDRPVEIDQLRGNAYAKRLQVPGARHIMTALLLAIVSSAMLLINKYTPADNPNAKTATVPFFERFGVAAGILILVAPIVPPLVATIFSLHPRRRRIWAVCTAALGVLAVVGFFLYLTDLLAVGFMIYGMSWAKRVEGPLGPTRASRRRAAAAAEQEPDDSFDPLEAPAESEAEPGER